MKRLLLIGTAIFLLQIGFVYAEEKISDEVFSNLSIVLDNETTKKETPPTTTEQPSSTDETSTPTPQIPVDPNATFGSKLEYKRDRNSSNMMIKLSGLEDAKITENANQISIEIPDRVLEQNGLPYVMSQDVEFNDRLIATHHFIDGDGINNFTMNLRDNVSYTIDKNSYGINIAFTKGATAVPRVVIDPGHGGHDPGTLKGVSKVPEKAYALKTSLLLRDILVQKGYDVVMTRDSDFYPQLKDRAKLANDLDADIFISIHYNSAGSAKPSGIETLVYQSSDNKRLATFVHNQLIAETGVINRGFKRGNEYIVLNRTKVPSILVELGFLTNPYEAKRINDDNYQHTLAGAIATGIDKYFGR